jgi:hypothetical protein
MRFDGALHRLADSTGFEPKLLLAVALLGTTALAPLAHAAVRPDSAAVERSPRPTHKPSTLHWLFGPSVGASIPTGAFRRGTQPGVAFGAECVVLGASQRAGLKLDLGAARHAPTHGAPWSVVIAGRTINGTSEGRNDVIWFDFGPQFEQRAGPSRLFAFITLGFLYLQPSFTGDPTGATGDAPPANLGECWSLGGGARIPIGGFPHSWLALQIDSRRRTDANYIGDPPVVTDQAGRPEVNAVHGIVKIWSVKLSLLRSPE